MALFLVQHGRSASKEADPEKGLTAQGIEETKHIAQVASGYAIPVARVVHSGKKRAEQTAAIFQATLSIKQPATVIPGINPLDDVHSFAATIRSGDNMMVVGHMPFMQRLVSLLTAGSDTIRVYQFQNSGIVCLDTSDMDGEIDWFIKWTLNPDIS